MSVLATMGLEGGNDLLVGVCGLAGFLVLAVANLGLVVFDRWYGGQAITRGFSLAAPTADSSAGITERVNVNSKGGFGELGRLRDSGLNPIG